MALINFTRNHNDLSTDRGFQFEFFRDRCGSGYQSTFKGSASGAVTDVLDVASGLLGGLFGSAANASQKIHSAAPTAAAVQQARQVAQEATYVTKEKFEKAVVGACPNCGAGITPNAKFCTECGTKIEGSPKFCPECGAKQGNG